MELNVFNPRKISCRCLLVMILLSPLFLSCHKDQSVNNSNLKTMSDSMSATANKEAGIQNFTVGSVIRDVWNDNYGNDVAQVPVQTKPSASSLITQLEGPVDNGVNYGVRIRGYVIAPATGNYTFWIAADDSGELWLSTGADPAYKVKIASTLSWTSSREFTKFSQQQSSPVALKAGQKYYFEILQKQGGGGANLAVRWKLPDGKIETPISGTSLAAYSESSNASYVASPVISLYNQHDITIEGKFLSGGSQPLITLNNCYNIRITGNKFSNSTNVGVYLYNCRNITIQDNFFTTVSSGVYADHCNGAIVVNSNEFLNMRGPFPRGQFVQFNNVKGAGSSISYNKGENVFGSSYPEDAISLYQSAGTASSPVLIKGNWIRGGGPSTSGGGIMLGDNGGSYLVATDNLLVNPGQFGMAIAGGDHISIYNNSIYGRQQYFTNVGLYVNDIGGYRTTDCVVRDNKVRFYNAVNYQNNAWLSPNSIKPAGWDNNVWGANIDASILPAVIITKR